MDYEKAYKEALERAKGIHSFSSDIAEIKRMEQIFPELKESEDDRIRKCIYNYINVTLDDYSAEKEKWLAWLEKQGDIVEYYEDKLDRCACEYFNKGYKETLEKQGEEKPNGGIVLEDFNEGNGFYKVNLAYLNKRQVEEIEAFVSKWNLSDKVTRNEAGILVNISQRNRVAKPADKVEPKFHKGDFIKHNKANIICKIVSVNSGSYYVENIETGGRIELFNAEQNFHLYTIQDAKDGDVLSNGTTIFIFKDLLSDGSVMSYCDYDIDSGESDAFCPLSMNLMCSKITPATKEQCDTLFTKMKEAGWEWSTKKNELKKIDNEEVNGEDYSIDSLFHAQRILEKTLGKVDGYQSDDGILEHKCAISTVKKLYEKKPTAWTEEDENLYQDTLDAFEALGNDLDPLEDWGRLYDWLKSLKDRVQPQPKQKWTEEDEVGIGDALWAIKQARTIAKDENDMGNLWYAERWLKSLKQRIGG